MLLLDRTVLCLLDDALYVYRSNLIGQTQFVQSIDWHDETFVQSLIDCIDNKCKSAPVILLHDMIEQYYRKERVYTVGVGSLDKSMMVSRKLSMVFPSYSVRAYVPVKDTLSKDSKKNKSDVYLFMAIASSKHLSLVSNTLKICEAHFLGLGLLPYESVSLVDALINKIKVQSKSQDTDKDKDKGQWNLFLGQQRNGNLRQIVIKNGEIALTRMTSLPVGDDLSDAQWSANVVKEMQATMNYLGRLGFRASDGLNIILVSDETKASSFLKMLDGDVSFYHLTQQKAAELAGVKVSDEEKSYHADCLHVGWIAKKLVLSAALPFVAMERVSQARWVVSGLSLVLICAAIFLASNIVGSYASVQSLKSGYDRKNQQLRTLQIKYNKETDKLASLGIDLPLVQSSSFIYKHLELGNPDILHVMQVISNALDGRHVLEHVSFGVNAAVLNVGDKAILKQNKHIIDTQRSVRTYSINFSIRYDGDFSAKDVNAELRSIALLIQKELEGHSVEIVKFLQENTYQSSLVVNEQKDQSKNYNIAELVIRGAYSDE